MVYAGAQILTEKQWRQLYPNTRQAIDALSSKTFDARMLTLLLQSVCHLSPPYPHGWAALPLPHDTSVSADVVRLQVYLHQTHFIYLVKSSWGTPDGGALVKLSTLGTGKLSPRARNTKRHTGTKNPGGQEGVSPEERAVLTRTHRLLCDSVMAEDVVDRLVQGQVLHFNDKQKILTPGKNADRMQLLLSKILHSKQDLAFKVLLDGLKFKYPLVHDSLSKVKNTIQKEGVNEIMDMVSVCQEGLTAHYLTALSRITPFPWSQCQTSIRDVFVPLELVTAAGKKLSLSQLLPAAVTSGRGRRILVEGETGSGKTYLTAMLTYLWSSQKTYFTSGYPFLIYLDARLVQGPLHSAVHCLTLPDNFKVGPDEFWSLLEVHARDTVFIIDGFDEDQSHGELKEVILGDKLSHASVLMMSRPEARAGRWMKPDERVYVLGLSNLNVGRCLKSYAVIAQMTSEEYEEFHEVINNPDFQLRSQMSSPYVCLIVFGIYLSTRGDGLRDANTLTSLLQQYLVAMASGFCRSLLPDWAKGRRRYGDVPTEIAEAVSHLQFLAYSTLVSKQKLLREADLENVTQLLRACLTQPFNGDVTGKVTFFKEDESPKRSVTVNGHPENGDSTTGGKTKRKGQSSSSLSYQSLMSRVGFLSVVGGHSGREYAATGNSSSVSRETWSFTCSLMREFLAARHLAGMKQADMERELKDQRALRHPRFAQTTAFLCGLLFLQDGETATLTSLFKDVSIEILRHSRLTFKDDVPSLGATTSEKGSGQGTPGSGADLLDLSHALLVLQECSLTLASGTADMASELAKSLPKVMAVRRNGLMPLKCLHGLGKALRSPGCLLTRLEVDLLPYFVFQISALQTLAEALSAGAVRLRELVVRWHSLSLLTSFLKACLANAPHLECVVAEDCSKMTRVASEALPRSGAMASMSGHSVNVNATTWAELQQVCALLRNTRSFSLVGCWAVHVVTQWAIYLPTTMHSLDFTACAFNSISASDLGAKLQSSRDCTTLVLADTGLGSSEMAALFHNLKLNSSLRHLSLAGCRLGPASALALAEYLRLDNSLHDLDLTRCHVTDEACHLLAAALRGNRSLVSVDLTEATIGEAALRLLQAARPDGKLKLVGVQGEYYI